ncbi:MAG: hypothetical protein KAH38_01135 [Candidatus Hydrogenedentes bacterium]|nr:hypothetical protein [Candidatus Hydrogenedentota bacterium]
MDRAKDMDLKGTSRNGIFFHIRKLIASLIMLAVVLFALGFTATMVYIPVLSEITYKARFIIWNIINGDKSWI